MPTFCDYAGVSVPPGLTGHSLRPWAERSPTALPNGDRLFVVTEVSYKGPLSGRKVVDGLLLRSSDFTYISYSAGTNPEQFFDVRRDPGQSTNLVTREDYTADLEAHRKWLRDWVTQTRSPFPLDKIP